MDLVGAKAESLGHLGLIASTLQELGVAEKINKQLGELSQGKVSYGHRVCAMVLNGLGFCNTALYMTPRFFHDKPIDLLLDAEVKASDLNDDCLGRCLDEIASYGVTRWYSELAFALVGQAGLLSGGAHLDSTTLSLYGSYDNYSDQVLIPCHGYSKDARPDLKQVTLQCVGLGRASLPVWMESLNGNSSDKGSFPETVKRIDAFCQALSSAPRFRFIADSALYGKALESLEVQWLTRVPEVYKEAKELCAKAQVTWQPLSDDRYQVFAYQPENAKERWLLVRSALAFDRENKTFLRRHEKQFDALYKALWHCSCQAFNCQQDAKKAVDKIIRAKKHLYLVDYRILEQPYYSGKGRPQKDSSPDGYRYVVELLGISSDYQAIQAHRKTLGRFILATNVLDKETFSDELMLLEYKEQSGVEAGFKFIKNDAIGLDAVYLKKPNRIAALMAVMTLCLLIYGMTQYQIRQALKDNDEVLPDQKGKPTQTPTLMWIFSLFSCVTLIRAQQNKQEQRIALNLQPLHEKVICLLGDKAKKIYLIPYEQEQQHVQLNQKTWIKWCGM